MIQYRTVGDIAVAIGITESYMLNIAARAGRFYKIFRVKKASGGTRQLEAPGRKLKAIQTWILRSILEPLPVSDRAFGFVRGGNTKKHAAMHASRNYVLIMDIKDFFPSIRMPAVRNVFSSCVYDPAAVEVLTRLCTYKKRLPQGGVTSPLLSNLVFRPVDEALQRRCDRAGIRYSRYADDLAFSADNKELLKGLELEVKLILGFHGFRVNTDKTRYLTGKGRMVITGLCVNAGHPTTGRHRKRELRAGLFNAIVKGDKSVDRARLMGTLAYVRGVEPDYYGVVRQYVRRLQSKWHESGGSAPTP